MTDETPRGDGGPALAAVVARGTIDVPDFPKPGVVFKDLMPLFADGPAFRTVVDGIVAHYGADGFDVVAGVEARGFVVAAAVAYATGSGVVPVRKAGKLPWDVHRQEYVLEYGTDLLEIHRDAIDANDRVLVIDDVLATGGTAAATVELVGQSGATVDALAFVMELAFLDGRAALGDVPATTLLTYS